MLYIWFLPCKLILAIFLLLIIIGGSCRLSSKHIPNSIQQRCKVCVWSLCYTEEIEDFNQLNKVGGGKSITMTKTTTILMICDTIEINLVKGLENNKHLEGGGEFNQT